MLQFKTEKLTDRVTRIYGFCGERKRRPCWIREPESEA